MSYKVKTTSRAHGQNIAGYHPARMFIWRRSTFAISTYFPTGGTHIYFYQYREAAQTHKVRARAQISSSSWGRNSIRANSYIESRGISRVEGWEGEIAYTTRRKFTAKCMVIELLNPKRRRKRGCRSNFAWCSSSAFLYPRARTHTHIPRFLLLPLSHAVRSSPVIDNGRL